MLKEATILSPSAMDEQLLMIKRNFHFPLKGEVLDAIANGSVNYVYSKNTKMPTSLPFFLLQNNDRRVNAIVAIDLYGTYNAEDDRLNVDAKKIYTLGEASLLALKLLPKTDIALKTPILKEGAKIYSAMFTRILNKAYALNTNKSKLDSILFISACFYLINVLGLSLENKKDAIMNYAKGACKMPNAILLDDYFAKFVDGCEQCPFTSLETFLQRIIALEPGFRGLTVRGYLESFLTTYGAANLLSLEMLEYLTFNVVAVMHASFFNNQYVLENVFADSGSKFYSAIIES